MGCRLILRIPPVFVVRAVLSSGNPMPTLLQHVLRVVLCSTEKEVIGVAALRHVALVADEHPVRDLAYPEHVRRSMCPYRLTLA